MLTDKQVEATRLIYVLLVDHKKKYEVRAKDSELWNKPNWREETAQEIEPLVTIFIALKKNQICSAYNRYNT